MDQLVDPDSVSKSLEGVGKMTKRLGSVSIES